MTWTIEKGWTTVGPIGEHENVPLYRVWRFHPTPWKIIFDTTDLAVAEQAVEAHNEEIRGIFTGQK